MLGWTQSDLAARSGVAKRSIAGLELEDIVPKPETLERIVSALLASGIEFQNTDADLAGVVLRKSCRTKAGSFRRRTNDVPSER
jgi:transcriptional regulator with XRE-family HTH domain